MPSDATTDLLALMSPRKGHFRFESGHHGETWLEIPRLFLRPASLRPFVKQLARRLSPHRVEAVCGPAVEGALLAQMVAEELELAFFFAEKVTDPHGRPTGPATHQIPESLRDAARGKSFAVVDDVINAGSAVQAVLDDLSACGARPVAIGALLVLGQSAGALAASRKIPLEAVAQHETPLWEPWACPLCAAGRALSSPESDPGEA